MLISTGDPATSKVIIAKKYHSKSTFQFVGSGADIVLEGPDSDFDVSDPDSYTGGWVPLVYGGEPVVLGAETNHLTLYGAIVIRVTKTASDGAGVLWQWG
jgi:hypothetical protein